MRFRRRRECPLGQPFPRTYLDASCLCCKFLSVGRANIACLAFMMALSGLGQIAQESGNRSRLEWDWRRADELSWKESISRTKNKNMTQAERNRLIAAITEQLRSSAADLGIGSNEELRNIAGETRVKYVHLSKSRVLEVIAQAGGERSGCSPTGNCPFWVLRRRGSEYEVLLEAEAQTFTIQPIQSRGFSDLVLARHGSAFESEARVYKFNGESYASTRCYDVQWSEPDGEGEYHRLKKPQIIGCDT